MSKTHWESRSQHWGRIGPPLVPNQEVINAFTQLIPTDSRILLLGVTPQIANAYTNVTAVDFSPPMIERVWPGNTATKQAIEDNWLTVDLADSQFDGVLGDGSINMVGYPNEIRFLFKRTYLWLKPGGRFAMRFFTRPDVDVTREQIIAEGLNPTMGFSAYRRLLPMYVAASEGNSCIRQSRMLEVFDELFPDRSVLKWDPEHVKSMDSYRGTTTTSWFPTRQEILEFVAEEAQSAGFVDAGTYELANTCPILTFTR
jgi:SAM-dependent methyltransferase